MTNATLLKLSEEKPAPTGTITKQALAREVLDALDATSGVHPGYRPAHAKRLMWFGAFTPSPEAAKLTRAPHANRPSTPVTVRYSDSTGLPTVPDNDPARSGPRGVAIQGAIDAPVALVEYGDYECPYCGLAYPIIKAIQKRLGERMSFVFRNFPLVNAHPHAQHAAEAAEAAGAQGRFWEMHDLLFENQDALEDENLAQYAQALGLDARRLMGEVLAGAHTARVREDFRSGTRGGVNGTPTLFINGARYEGVLDATALLDSLLNPD